MTDERETIRGAIKALEYASFAWVVLLAMLGGVANFFRKLRDGQVRPFNFVELLGELFIAAFSGICTFLLCEAARLDPILTAALVAISGHMGSRAVFMFESVFARKFGVRDTPK